MSVSSDLVSDLTDLLRAVTGRAAIDPTGEITVETARGVPPEDVARDVRSVIHRWTAMHPGIRVHVRAAEDARPQTRRPQLRRRVRVDGASPSAVGRGTAETQQRPG